MAKTKEIQGRLKSINNIRKITKAMEMVSASKMRRSVDAVLRTRTYANLSWETALNLAALSQQKQEPLHPLLSTKTVIKRVAIIVISSNRGLAGGFNANLLSKVKESIKKYHFQDDELVVEPEFILIGKKGESLINLGYKVAASFPKSDLLSSIDEIKALKQLVVSEYLTGHYDKVLVAYTDFINPVKQVARIKQLLPIDINAKDDYLGVVGKSAKVGTHKSFIEAKSEAHITHDKYIHEYLFEPSTTEVLDKILPKLIEVQLYQAMLESNASEHSARMTSMHQASEAAQDMADELTLYFNKARQASITAEIAEISAGANALIDN